MSRVACLKSRWPVNPQLKDLAGAFCSGGPRHAQIGHPGPAAVLAMATEFLCLIRCGPIRCIRCVTSSAFAASESGNAAPVRMQRPQGCREGHVQGIGNARTGGTHPWNGIDRPHAGGEVSLITAVLTRLEADLKLAVKTRLTVNHDPPGPVRAAGPALRPIRCEVVSHPVDVLDRYDLFTSDHAYAAGPDRSHGPRLDDTAGGIEVARCGLEFAGLAYLVQLHCEGIGHHSHRRSPPPSEDSRAPHSPLVIEWLSEPE